jgi:DNA polymerase-3 subunit epsilon
MKWFKSKSYPSYWQDYKACFKTKPVQDLNSTRIVIFDTETTGLNTKEDVILSIGCIAIKELKIKVSDQFECYVSQQHFNSDTVKIHGLLKEGQIAKVNEEEAIIEFLDYIKDAVLVAHHAAFDVAMINAALKRLQLPPLKNKVLDTGHLYMKTRLDTSKSHFSLDELSERL